MSELDIQLTESFSNMYSIEEEEKEDDYTGDFDDSLFSVTYSMVPSRPTSYISPPTSSSLAPPPLARRYSWANTSNSRTSMLSALDSKTSRRKSLMQVSSPALTLSSKLDEVLDQLMDFQDDVDNVGSELDSAEKVVCEVIYINFYHAQVFIDHYFHDDDDEDTLVHVLDNDQCPSPDSVVSRSDSAIVDVAEEERRTSCPNLPFSPPLQRVESLSSSPEKAGVGTCKKLNFDTVVGTTFPRPEKLKVPIKFGVLSPSKRARVSRIIRRNTAGEFEDLIRLDISINDQPFEHHSTFPTLERASTLMTPVITKKRKSIYRRLSSLFKKK
jgi:hypothetical protein